jgi:hypothetical protein
MVDRAKATIAVRELEALLIMVLGSRNQNQVRFTNASRWEQVTLADCQRGKALTKVDRNLVLDWEFRAALSELE